MQNYIAEFFGTYILCLVILVIYKQYNTWSAETIGIMISTLATLILFSRNDSDFNPVVTLMYYLDGVRTTHDLIYFIFAQFLAGVAAYVTIRVIF
jgi:glycerol uptake facilitator-like aquaporin